MLYLSELNSVKITKDFITDYFRNTYPEFKNSEQLWNLHKLYINKENSILNNISDNIENNLTSQVESIEKIDKYTQNWSKYYEKKDFTNMERQFNKIQKELEKVVPLESVITKARQLENIHNLIKNNGKNFNLTQEELELANKLV